MIQDTEDIRNEDYISVECWDDATGGWYEVAEAKDSKNAGDIVKRYMENDEPFKTHTYSVVTHKREVYQARPAS